MNVSVSAEEIEFSCEHPTAVNVEIFTNASTTCISNGTRNNLTFTNLSGCHTPVAIWCRAYFVNGMWNFNSSQAILYIQGMEN